MNIKEVQRLLQGLFHKKLTNGRKRHLVFWYDEQGEFVNDIEEIKLSGVRKWMITENNLFATMYELEKKDPDSHFLLYANMPKPSPRDNWLYDQLMLGEEFATDRITVIMRELGLKDDSLREKLQHYQLFFNNKARLASFRKYSVDQYTHEQIDLTVLAALLKSPTNRLDDIVKTLFIQFIQGNEKGWQEIKKWGDKDVFWKLVETYYGYTAPEKTLVSLQISFLMTYVYQMNQVLQIPVKWDLHQCEKPANVVVFINQWMNHREDYIWYNKLADAISDKIGINRLSQKWNWKEVLPLDAFRIFDEQMIAYLSRQLTNHVTDFETYDDIIATRRHLHWYDTYQNEYEALFHANHLLRLLHQFDNFIAEQPASLMFKAYAEEYYQIDTAYRKFYIHYDRISIKDRLLDIRNEIENAYVNHYMQELAMKWTMSLDKAVTKGWTLPNLDQQAHFYQDWIRPYEDNEERVFVIVSDALRYEIAKELMDTLNNEQKASTELTALQGMIPSYTALGMASLLPYETLEVTSEGQVLNDGYNSSGINNRNAILKRRIPESIALHFDELAEMKRQEMRQTLQGKKVVYIYHNVIDARGDHAATESEVFQAAEEAIKDIHQLIHQLVNNVSASNILITADHGFMYQRDKLPTSQKVPRIHENKVLVNRRFILTEEAPSINESVLTYSLGTILETPLYVTVPKGNSRFAVQGAGANFVHGGTMLQEIVIPVITFKNDRSKSQANITKKVDVKLTTSTRKITNMETHLTFVQIQRVEDKHKRRILTMYFVDEDGELVSNKIRLIADRLNAEVGNRTFREKFIFKDLSYDRRKTYELILEDETENTIYDRYPFTIDIVSFY